MSTTATEAVWEHSVTVGTARLVMLAIADSANHEGWHSYDTQETIARRTNVSVRAVERAIKSAIDIGELEVHRPDRSSRNQYSVMLSGLKIFEDPEERERRDAHYGTLALGRAERTRQNRANRHANKRSEDPTPPSGPRPQPPDASVGSHPTPASGPDPTPPSGHHPTPASGLKETNNLNNNKTPEKLRAQAAEGLWSRYPHHRRDLNAQRTLDTLIALGVEDVAGIERVTAALEEDIRSTDWRESFIPKLTNWLKDRKWDRPLVEVAHLPLGDLELIDLDPDLDRAIREAVGDDVTDVWVSQCWHGRRGNTYVLGGPDRVIGWLQLRYAKALSGAVYAGGFDGIELLKAKPPTIQEAAA